jgi:twitching motility protein PilT
MGVEINKLLQMVLDHDASDLHLTVGRPPCLRISGSLRSVNLDDLTAEDMNGYMKAITSDKGQMEITEVGSTDFGFSYEDKARFRASVFKQRGQIAIVLRVIPNRILAFNELGLPSQVKDYVFKPRGLFLVTGPTGSGKSTTLASLINMINEERPHHIITIEDPIEFYHEHKKSLINQREVGIDVPSFSEALRRALREDPDVILVGEMRDLETIQAAISAAETGHLVFGTLHTTGAAETISRLVDAFPTNQQEQVRTQLSSSLCAIITQALLPRVGGGRVPAFEILFNTHSIAHLIRENRIFGIESVLQTNGKRGMVTRDDHLFKLYTNELIDFANTIEYCKNREDMTKKIREYQAAKK